MRRLLPRPTLRLRLTLLYGGLFLVAGAVLLTITYELVSHSAAASPQHAQFIARSVNDSAAAPKLPSPAMVQTLHAQGAVVTGQLPVAAGGVVLQQYAGKLNTEFRKLSATQAKQFLDRTKLAIRAQQSDQLGALLTTSGIALGIMAIISIALGWLIAGRALRPVRTMSARARGISERNLHARLALDGPNDELKELGNTFDDLLGRLEAAFESQRRFVANASHELRTPITLERTLVEVALADPNATTASLRAACERILAANQNQAKLIDALLTLARSQRGLATREELRLDELAREVLAGVRSDGVRVESELGAAATVGDPALIERLIGNLVDNALRYNLERDGWLRVWTGVDDGRPALRVVNSGQVVPAEEALALTEPFRRLNGNRISAGGSGLGLSIVAAIATAHGARLRTLPREDGGLEVEVAFPALVAGQRGVPLDSDVALHG